MDTLRPLSWSAISSFQYSPPQWAKKYLDGVKSPPTPAMKFGKEVGERIAADVLYLPTVPRLSLFEYELTAKLGERNLTGWIDTYEPHTALCEYKTGKEWTQKRADEHGQITMYLLMLNLMHKVKPEDVRCRLVWLRTQENGDFSTSFIKNMQPHIFETKRTMMDILNFGAYIHDVYKQMQEYAHERGI